LKSLQNHDTPCSDAYCHDSSILLAALSDVGFSPQSTRRYRRDDPPVCALLPVKAVTGMAALGVPYNRRLSLSLCLSLSFFFILLFIDCMLKLFKVESETLIKLEETYVILS
jgi:hypothetical protein